MIQPLIYENNESGILLPKPQLHINHSRVSADDKDSRPLLSHGGQAVDHHVVHQPVLVLFLLLPLFPCGQGVADRAIDRSIDGVTDGVTAGITAGVTWRGVRGESGALRWARQLRGELLQCQCVVSKEVEHGHSHHDHHEGAHSRDHIHRRHGAPLLEQDDGGAQDHGGEQHVVNGVHHLSVEDVQRFV